MSLPKWIEVLKVKDSEKFTGMEGCDCVDPFPLFEALSIAWEVLEKVKASHNDGILRCRDLAGEALRRIEELGK